MLIYEIDLVASGQAARTRMRRPRLNMGDLVQALTNRINPSGTKEIVIRPYGDRQVEIIIPEVDAEEVGNIKRQISTAGLLEFRIVANTRDHQDIIALAEEQAQDPDPARRISKNVVRNVVAEGVAKEERVGYLGPGREREAQGRGTRRQHSAEFGHRRDDRSQVAESDSGQRRRCSRITWRATGWRTSTSWWP